MLTSLALIFLIGLAAGALSQALKLPRIVGMLLAGILLGPFALNLLDGSILSVSAELRRMALVIILNLVRSRSGRAIMALRDNRIAAESVGINVTKYKMMAFVTSAALAGAAGALYGLNYSNLLATKFNFNTSILVLVFVVLGGLGNIRGSIIAAAILTVLPEMLRSFADYRMLVYAIVLILVMLGTNNAQLKSLFTKIIPTRSRKEAK